ncbi:response regulator transcription factor [Planosporangium mesophilum]|uniref:DNA-binding response regulator n=1 Tax=Planosporangium mesophilum TaxID=689768 RepID=A0A8J3WZZ0_9ACTN|nr:response regulator transcription factor [Planosporangium mesophilum]NJC82652.1 response regulator transcription factor [Planosporangium mesophilum]GII21799.1 DNA-binding response regulator [Planosporangium mesophilum]
MRLLICDQQVVFAEALAHLLTAAGAEVVAVTHHPDRAVAVLRREAVEVCLVDVGSGPENRLADLCEASPGIPVVLLTGEVDDATLAAARAAGVRGVADKRRSPAEILDLLRRVRAGESVVCVNAIVRAPEPRTTVHPRGDMQRLAGFLTPREREVLGALVRGDDTTRLARSLGIAAATARCHIQNVLTKLGAHSRVEAATSAVRHGMVNPETGAWLGCGRQGS